MTRPAPFTQAQIQRMIRAARAEGYKITGVASDGTLILSEDIVCSPSNETITLQTDPFLAGIEGLKNAEAKGKRKRVSS